jgi:hypothetical protein
MARLEPTRESHARTLSRLEFRGQPQECLAREVFGDGGFANEGEQATADGGCMGDVELFEEGGGRELRLRRRRVLPLQIAGHLWSP